MLSFSAIATVVTVAEILKNNGLAVEKSKILDFYASFILCLNAWCSRYSSWEHYSHSICISKYRTIGLINFLFSSKIFVEIMTSTVDMKDESRGRPLQKAKVRSDCNVIWNVIVISFIDLSLMPDWDIVGEDGELWWIDGCCSRGEGYGRWRGVELNK